MSLSGVPQLCVTLFAVPAVCASDNGGAGCVPLFTVPAVWILSDIRPYLSVRGYFLSVTNSPYKMDNIPNNKIRVFISIYVHLVAQS